MNALGLAAAPFALRSQTELRNGAATTAPPTPRRNTLRCILVVMFWAPRRLSGSCTDAHAERVHLGEVGEDVDDGVRTSADAGSDLIRYALILWIRIAAVGKRSPILCVGRLSLRRGGDPLHELQGAGHVLGRAVPEVDGGLRVDSSAQLIHRLPLTDPVEVLHDEAGGIDDVDVAPSDGRTAHRDQGGDLVAVGGVGARRLRGHGGARRR